MKSYNTVNLAADNSICISVVDCLNNLNTSQLRDKPIALVNGKLKWYGNFESLKYFVETTLNLKGRWSSPGGHLRLFSDASDSVVVRFYTNSASLSIQGAEVKTFTNILVEKIAGDSQSQEDKHETSNAESIEEIMLSDSNFTSNLPKDFASGQSNNTTDCPHSNTSYESVDIGSDSNELVETDIAYQISSGVINQSINQKNETQTLYNGQNYLGQKVSTNIESLKSTITKLESTVYSLETIIKDHDAILSFYNNAVDLNAKYLKEINDSKQYIICPEQKLVKVEEERDSLQLATRLIAQHKYCQNEGVRQLPTQSYTLTASSFSSKEKTPVFGKMYTKTIMQCVILIITNN